jgi:hypothetical protein
MFDPQSVSVVLNGLTRMFFKQAGEVAATPIKATGKIFYRKSGIEPVGEDLLGLVDIRVEVILEIQENIFCSLVSARRILMTIS